MDGGFAAGNSPDGAENCGDGPPPRFAIASLRRGKAQAIREGVLGLSGQAGREDFVVCTYPVLKQINDLLAGLLDAEAEGNAREILRQLRNTLMDGGWKKYRDPAARSAAADVLKDLAEAVEVLPHEADEAFDRLYRAGLNPVGARLFPAAEEDERADADEQVFD